MSQPSRPAIDTPDKRLTYLCRVLIQSSTALSVYELSEMMFVSDYTVESDLSRARELLRSFDLKLVRRQDLLYVTGPERGRRRLVRQLLYGAERSLVPATWNALVSEFTHIDVQRLHAAVQRVLEEEELDLHEYALGDIVLHLVVTVDRVQHGHVLPKADHRISIHDPQLMKTVQRLAEIVQDICGVNLQRTELEVLYNVLSVRQVAVDKNTEAAVDPDVRVLVNDLLEDLSAKYFLTATAEASKAGLNLALHVQGLLARARSETPLPHALGKSFKSSHPMLHDLALDFAFELEKQTGLRIAEGEFDYLALHMGMYYLPSFKERDLVTITLVTPRFYDMADSLAEQLHATLKGFGIVETVAQAINFDFATTTSDLIISTVPPAVATPVPVVLINPIPTSEDLTRVVTAVRAERDRAIRRRIRSTLSTLIDPALFVHHQGPLTQTEALTILSNRLHDAGYTDPHFLSDVLDRESRSSTAFGGDFAIPHSMRMDAHASAIAPLVSDTGIPWGNSRVRLVLLFALSPDGRQVFRDVLDEITHMLAEGYRVSDLINAGSDADRFIETFMDILDRESNQ
ncbi:MAG: PTS sugar transporter subunit IIA [Ancrocorticia sp.]